MSSTVQLPEPPPNWRDLPLTHSLNAVKLGQMQACLNILTLALASLIPLETADIQSAANQLGLENFQVNSEFSVPFSSPQQWQSDDNTISIEEVRSRVILICHLARQSQELLRRAVTLMEQMQEQDKDASKTALLGEYLANFQKSYSVYRLAKAQSVGEDIQTLAFKLLIDLLFYSATNGHRRLWLVLLEETPGLTNETVS